MFGFVEDAWDAVSELGEDAVDLAGDAIDAAGDALEDAGDALEDAAEWLEDKAEETADAIEDAADWLADEAGELWDDVVAEAGDVFEAIEDFAEERWKDAVHFVDDLSDQIADAVEDAWQAVAQAAESAWEGIASAAEQAWEWAASGVENAWDAIGRAAERAWEALEDAATWVANTSAKLLEDALTLAESLAHWVWDIVKGIGEFLAAVGACLGGEIVYQLAKADNVIVNDGRPYSQIPADVRNRLAGIFPNESFTDVLWVDQASLAANHFKSGTEGMTFGLAQTPIGGLGHIIYLKPKFDFSQATFKRLLVHELVHVLQYRRFGGELGFACAYGIGYAKAGFDYRKNPFEDEAYAFVTANGSVVDAL